MTTRAFANISNLPGTQKQAEDKRLSRASRKVLTVPQQKPTNTVLVSGKENRVDNLCNGQRKVRQTRVAARKLYSLEQEIPMEVEQQVEEAEKRIFPLGVKDIDAEDAFNPQLCSEYALETFAYLKQMEKRGEVKANYLTGCPTSDKMRAVLVDWMVEVQVQFKLLQETLFLTVNTIDRYFNLVLCLISNLAVFRFLAIEGKSVHRSKLQLVGVAAMFLVCKIEEVYAPAVSDFVYITDNAYTEAEIKYMELRIIRALNFDLCQPIPLNFLRLVSTFFYMFGIEK